MLTWILFVVVVLMLVVVPALAVRERMRGQSPAVNAEARRTKYHGEGDVRRSVQNPGNGPGMIGGS